MKDKVALVTGASSGIGRAACLRFAAAGAKVALAARRAAEGEETARLVREAGGEALFVQTDVSQPAQVEALVQRCVEIFGRLDYAFNNAGIEGDLIPTHETTEEHWDRIIAVNQKGAWLCMRAEIREMLKVGGGAIVNMSSVGGLISFPGLGAYVAAKHAVIGMTKTAALEYADKNLRVNVVCPGLIDTPMADRFTGGTDTETDKMLVAMTPMHRRGRPMEVAEAAVWLCSDAASFVTGHSMHIDGGYLCM